MHVSRFPFWTLVAAPLVLPSTWHLNAVEVPAESPLFDPGSLVSLERGALVESRPAPLAGVEVTFSSKTGWSLAQKPESGSWDLRPWRYLRVDIENTGSEIIVPEVRLRSGDNWDGWGEFVQGHMVVKPGERKWVLVPVWDRDFSQRFPWASSQFPKMTILPETWEFSMWRLVTANQIKGFRITLLNRKEDRSYRFVLHSVKAVLPMAFPTEAQIQSDKWFPFMDRFGQYNRRDWPGKIRKPEDFAAARAEEEALLSRLGPLPDRNLYGGYEKGPTLKATGHFRVEKVAGKWWMVDPLGKLFWSKGATGVGPTVAPATLNSDRKLSFFEIPPDPKNPLLAPFMVQNEKNKTWSFEIGSANLARKYGPDWRKLAMESTLRRYPAYGMNTLGAWCAAMPWLRDPSNAAPRQPYTVILHLWSTPIGEGMPDALDPAFEKNIEAGIAKAAAEGHDRDPWCVGFFIDNEVPFPNTAQLAKAVLAAPKNQGARKQATELALTKYGSLEALNRAWGTEWASLQTLQESPVRDFKLNGESTAFFRDFNSRLAEAYYGTIRRVMTKHLPHKLYLGSRINRNVVEYIQASAKYCDVVSFNKYELDLRGLRLPQGSTDAPIMVGEFCFVRGGRTHDSSSLGDHLDPDYRPRAYANYIAGCLENPAIVGAHWFQWSTQAISGRGDGENYEQGFVDSSDTVYRNLAEASRKINEEMYDLRLNDKEYRF